MTGLCDCIMEGMADRLEEIGVRDHIANLRWMMEKAREHQRDLYMYFIDNKKAFDCVDHEILWVILRDMRVPVPPVRKPDYT